VSNLKQAPLPILKRAPCSRNLLQLRSTSVPASRVLGKAAEFCNPQKTENNENAQLREHKLVTGGLLLITGRGDNSTQA